MFALPVSTVTKLALLAARYALRVRSVFAGLFLAQIAPLGQVHLLAQIIRISARVVLLAPTLLEVLLARIALRVRTKLKGLLLAQIAPLGQVHLVAQFISLNARVALLVPTLMEVLVALLARRGLSALCSPQIVFHVLLVGITGMELHARRALLISTA